MSASPRDDDFSHSARAALDSDTTADLQQDSEEVGAVLGAVGEQGAVGANGSELGAMGAIVSDYLCLKLHIFRVCVTWGE